MNSSGSVSTPARVTMAPSAPEVAATSGPGAPAAPLHETPFPDGSGSIGLPDGWTITGAHAGEVTAKGPASAVEAPPAVVTPMRRRR
jgi:hypothetical protein